MDPQDGAEVHIVGVLRERRIDVDVYEALGMRPTPISAGFLGVLGTGNWGRITLHCQSHEDELLSYTAWVPTEMLLSDFQASVTLLATLTQQTLPVGNEWVCESLEAM